MALAVVSIAVAGTLVYLLNPADAPPPKMVMIDASDLPNTVHLALERARLHVVSEPSNGEAWGNFGMALYAHQFLPAALESFAEAARLAPRDPRWPYLRGMIRSERDPAAGIDDILLAARLVGEHPEIEMRLAELYFANGQFVESEAHFRHAEPSQKNVPRIQLGLARLAFQKGDFQECLRLAAAACQAVPDRRDIQELLARTYQRLGETKLAQEALQRAQELPEAEFWSDSILAEAVAMRVDPYWLLGQQADGMLQQGRLLEHLRLLDRLVQETPDDATSATRLARGLLYARDTKTAARVLDDALQRHPGAVEPMFLRAVVHYNVGEIPEAIELLNDVVRRKPDYVEAHYQLAACLRQSGAAPQGLQEMQTVLRLEPAFNPARIDLAELLLESGESAQARAHLETALKLEPANSRAKKLLEQVPGD